MIPGLGFSQIDSTDSERLEDYNWRIQQRVLFNVYIPADLQEAFEELKDKTEEEALDRFKRADVDEIGRKLFFGLGKWMASNWQFYEGSRFSHYLRDMGITHPDDMKVFLIESFHLHLNNEDLNIEERVEELRERRLEKVRARYQRDTIKIDTLKNGN